MKHHIPHSPNAPITFRWLIADLLHSAAC